MSFMLPEDLATQLRSKVRASDRSRYIAAALAEKLNRGEARLIRACEIANRDPDVRQIEKTFDELHDAIAEPWDDIA